MKKMKHILVYEAFSSKTISKTLNFVDKKVGKDQKKKFLNVLREIKDRYDFPIDIIDDKWMDYLSKKEAYILNSSKTVDNHYWIQYLKFWFSLEKGYLGYSGVGNKVVSWKLYIDKDEGEKHNEPFSPSDIRNIIENNILPNKGKLITINNYKDLNHLDKCVLYADGDLTKATLWVYRYDGRDYIYAIQNSASGNTPDVRGDRRDWSQYGRR